MNLFSPVRVSRWSCLVAFALPVAAAEIAPLPPVVARYEQMLAASPAKGTAFDKVYQHFFENEGVDALDARWRARAAAGDDPNAASFLLLEGLLAERRAKPVDARTLYQQYTAGRPDDPRGWTVLGELETAEGRFGPAADALAHALAPEAKPPVPASARPTLYRELARAQTRNFLGAAALTTWRKLAAEFPDDPSVLQEVGEALQEAESYDEARTTFEKVRDLAKTNNDVFGRINAILRLGQIEEARGHAKAAVAIYEGVVSDAKPGSWLEREARARIEQLYRGQEDLPGLADYYKKWLEDHPKDVEVATRRAAALVELNHKDQAIDLLREAVAWAPDRQELQVELARRLGEVGRPAEMAAVMEKLTAVAPEEKSYWQLLGDARWQLLDLGTGDKTALKTQALEAWSHLSPADSKDAVATGQLADLFASHRLVDEALAQYARAVALAPDLPDARERWASYLAQLKRPVEARKVLAGLVAGAPTAANYGRLATGLDRLDDPVGALDANAKGLALEPKNFDLLAQRWQELSDAKKWDDAIALYPALLTAAPNDYFVEQVQTRQITTLQAAGRLADARKALASNLAALDERDLALLVRADFQTSDDSEAADEARRALAEGRTRFPASASLLRLEAEGAKRNRDPDGQVAALRHLLDLSPAQKTDALQEIAHVWRDAGRNDEALAAAHELVAASPANAASYLLEADLLLAGGNPEEGLSRLRQAVKLSERPNDVRLRLARAQAELGHETDARQTLDEAFEAAGDAHERLTLMKPLADAYQRENRLDELITRFQHLQQAEADGWRYALYLAEIYHQTLDYGAARRELAKALAARPKDGALMRQLVRLATEEQNQAEVARYQAQLAEAEPSDSNKFALVEALLENNQAEEGFRALRTHLDAVLKTPGAWDHLLPLLASNNLLDRAGDLLTAEVGGPGGDPSARFTLALFQAVAGKYEEAKAAFWRVFAEKSPRPPTPPAPAPVAGASRYALAIYGGESIASRRFRDGSQARFVAQQFLTEGGRGMGRIRTYYSSSAAGSATGNNPSPVDSARDTALLYLAAIAVKENAAEAFLAELDRQLAARSSSREDRLVAYALLDAVDPELREIAAQVQNPETGLDGFCFSRLVTRAQMNDPSYRRYSNSPILTEAQSSAMEPLFEQLFTRLSSNLPEAGESELAGTRYRFLKGIGRDKEADAIRQKMLAEAANDKTPASNLEGTLSILLTGDLGKEERDKLKTICAAMLEKEDKAGAKTAGRGQYSYYPLLLLQSNLKAGKLAPAEFAEAEGALFTLWYPRSVPAAKGAALGTSNPSGFRSSGNSARADGYMPPTRFLDQNQVQTLQQVAAMMGQGERLGPLRAELDRQAADMSAPRRLYPRLVSVYLSAASGAPEEALAASQALLADAPDDNDLRLLTGVLLGRNHKNAEAVAMLNSVTNARYGEAALVLQQQLLINAKEAKDNEAARRAALRLVNLRLTPEDRTALVGDLRELGINDKADQLARTGLAAPSSFSGRTPSIFDFNTASKLQSLVSAKNPDEALSLIRSVFTSMPPPANGLGNNADYVIERAVSALKQLNKTEEFIAALEKQLAADPDSLSLNYQLAVLTQDGSPGMTTEKRPSGTFNAPQWVKLTRAGNEVVGFLSPDGEKWQEVARATIDLGDAPLAALVAASSQTKPQAPKVVFDHVALAAAPGDPPAGDGLLPAPWTETMLPTDKKAPDTAPPAMSKDGVFTLSAAGWDLWGRYDDGRIVYRPLGEATELVARVASVEGNRGETKTGVMIRTDLQADGAYAAMIVLPGGMASFQHRDHNGAGRAEAYWRKVIALQPKETRYGRALARLLASRGLRPQAIAVYDALIAADPDDALGSSNDLSSVYGAERIAQLADRLLAWKPAPAAPGVSRSYSSYSFRPAAEACAQTDPEKAIALCRRGIELDSDMSGGSMVNVEIFELLIKTLLAQGRPNEAQVVLASCYLPGDPPAASSGGGGGGLQLGFQSRAAARRFSGNSWMTNISWGSDEIRLYSLGPLEAASKAGLLEEFQATLEKRRAVNPEDFANKSLDWLLTLVQITRRDAAVIEGLPALLAKTASAQQMTYGNEEEGQIAARLEIAKRLRQWPGHEALAVEAYRSASMRAAVATQSLSGPYSVDAMASLREAALDLQLDDPASAIAAVRNFRERQKKAPNSRNPTADLRKMVDLSLRSGPEADSLYLELYGEATASERTKKDYYFAYGMEKDQRVGDNPHYQALAWLLDDNDGGGAGADATLVYELRVSHPYDQGDLGQYPGSRGRSFAGSEGERALTFSYGPDAGHFATIGQLKTTSTFGTWTGPIPHGGGVLKVTIDEPRPADGAALEAEKAAPPTPMPTPKPILTLQNVPVLIDLSKGPKPAPGDYWLRIVRSPNLVVNPGFDGLENRDSKAGSFSLPGWSDLPAGFWRHGTTFGPQPGRTFVRCEGPRDQGDWTLRGARIPVEAGHAYFQSAWLRDGSEGGSAHFGCRYLDAQGNELGSMSLPEYGTLMWRHPSRRLLPAGTPVEGKDAEAMPEGVAFLEPFIRSQGAADWTGLFIGRAD